MSAARALGFITGPFRILSSTYGHCLKFLTIEPRFCSAGRSFLFCKSSFFNGRNTGGRSAAILTLSVWDFNDLAFASHSLRCWRSLKRTIIPAFSFLESLWHAEKSNADASGMPMWDLARSTLARLVSVSSSSAGPFRPCIVRFHLRLCMSTSKVWRANCVATFSTWRARDGSAVFSRSSKRPLIKSCDVSSPFTVSWMSLSPLTADSRFCRRSPISAWIASVVSLRIILRSFSSSSNCLN